MTSSVLRTPLRGRRKTIARRTTEAWQARVFHLTLSVDVASILAEKQSTENATVTDVLVHGCARALIRHRELNAHFDGEAILTYDTVNIRLAVAAERD